MNLFQLVLKQMRQRALGTVLTLISVLLGVSLATAIVIVHRGADSLLGQTSFGYDMVVGSKGSPLQLVVNTVYHISTSPGNIDYSVFEQMERDRTYRQFYRTAVPIAVGDSYQNLPLVGTLPRILGFDDETLQPRTGYDSMGRPLPNFISAGASDDEVESSGKQRRASVFEYRPDKKLILAQGKPFHREKFEAVIGSDVAKLTGLKLGSVFQATHGFPKAGETPDIHKPKWTVVGILEENHTANDRCLFIPLTSFYCLTEHGPALVTQKAIREGKDPALALEEYKQSIKEGHEAAAATGPVTEADHDDNDATDVYVLNPDGTIQLLLKPEDRALSAIMVKARGAFGLNAMSYIINNGQQATAANPATVMREFFANFIDNYSMVLLVVATLVTVVAGIGILVSIYNSVAARMREIAILRALGATRATVLSLICLEAGLIGLLGALLGVLVGHAVAGIGSAILERLIGQGINWTSVGAVELLYLAGVVVLAVLAGLVPALKAYRVPVATNLTA